MLFSCSFKWKVGHDDEEELEKEMKAKRDAAEKIKKR
jgi:hypothetical protein